MNFIRLIIGTTIITLFNNVFSLNFDVYQIITLTAFTILLFKE